ncbi:MAG: NifB/NifX family molybdenum-iron cluster-binding protein [Thermoplasmatota archaeon]
MRVSIPCMGDDGLKERISSHFGRAPYFAIFDIETEDLRFVPNESEHMGGSGKPPRIMDEEDVDIMLTANLGRRAIALFEEIGIKVYCGAEGTIQETLDQWEEGKLEEATKNKACEQGH